uniref:Putative ribonuclease H-like domain-containing protein n=1 Tax=Tanacetum cinerariifolium TaxID=118510 RepID=A0A6L2KKD2_TANCI|nr:putative ribonuclease H-like domain-containing protein [Tanacetum cinerariifolium]
MSSACNNIKLDSHNVISKVVCAMCKKCVISVNHDVCLHNYVNGKNSRGKKHKAKVLIKEKQKKHQLHVKKSKKVGFLERLATPKPKKPRFLLRWSPTGRLFDQKGKIVDSSESESQSDCSNGDNACTSNTLEPKIKRFPNSTFLLGRLSRFVYGTSTQFCDSDLEVAFRRNACFVKNLEGVDLLKGDRSTNLYTINLHEMASASSICLMARASSTKSWLWHQCLSHLKFDTRNDVARNNLVSGLPKFKYNKEHICPSCEQGKSKRASHPPKPVPYSRQRLHLLHMDLCGPMRIASINGKRYVLVIVDNYPRYTWVHFLKSKDETPEVIKTFLKRIIVLLQSPVIIIRTDNGAEFKNQRDEFKKFAANFVELVKLHKLKVSGLQAEISKQQKMHSDSEKRCSLIEQNHIALQVKSQNQLQEKDNVIKDLQKQISEMQVSRERSTEGRVKTQALEIALSQLKAQLASAHIQLNSYKEENKTLSQRYEELAKSNMASHVHICFMA